MPTDPTNPLARPFSAAAERIVQDRPEVPPDVVREVMAEAADRLHDGLALDGLDAYDTAAVVAGLCDALAEVDPGEAIRTRAAAATASGEDLHDPDGVRVAYLTAATILKV